MMALMIIAVVLLLFAAVAIILFENKNKGKNKGKPKSTRSQTAKKPGLINKTTWLSIYRKVDRFFLTRRSVRKVYKQVMHLSVYNSAESRIKAVKVWLIITTIELLGLIAAFALFGDVVMILLVYLFINVVKDGLILKQVDKVHFQVLVDLSLALSNLRQVYMRLNSVADAIAETEVSPLLVRAFEDIHQILTATKSDELLEEFYATTPFKLLQTLASVCYKLDSMGDTVLPDGSSSFLMSVSMINSEVQMEIRRLTQQKIMFGSLEYMPVAPLAAMPLIESFFSSNIPGTTVIFNGFIGYASQVIIVLTSIVGYMVISRMNSAVPIKKDDRSDMVQALLKIDGFEKIVKDIMPKSTKRLVSANKSIRSSLSSRNVKHVYAEKLFYSVSIFAFGIMFMLVSINLSRDFVYNNISEAGLVAGKPLTVDQVEKRTAMDKAYLALPEPLSLDDTAKFVKQYEGGLTTMQQTTQANRIIKKYNDFHGTYFKWWHLLVVYIGTLVGWFMPNILLAYRRMVTKTEAEEDVLQLQTVITILMFCNTDTIETLDWMQRQSDIHKNLLIDCYHEYPSNPEIALQKLKAKVSIDEFRRTIDRLLLTVHQVSMLDAFGDLIVERDHTLRIKEMTQDKALNKKRGLAKPLAMAPVYSVIALYFILPIGYLGVIEFMNNIGNLNM